MRISLTDAGKRFSREWIFRHVSLDFTAGTRYAITGPNGSGKSTLLQVIAGALMPSEGKVLFQQHGGAIEPEQQFRFVSLCGPYLELIEEMTATEFLRFHQHFKPLIKNTTISSILSVMGLENAAEKQIRYYSSGMKQRLKLAQAIFSDVPILLLDEPCTNLDKAGISLYQRLIDHHTEGRLVVVSSNDEQEYDFCDQIISVEQWKN